MIINIKEFHIDQEDWIPHEKRYMKCMDSPYRGHSICFKLQLSLCSVAVMARAFPVYSVEKRELILLQDAASYLLLACGAVYVVSVSLVNNTLFPNLIPPRLYMFLLFSCSMICIVLVT